jgi:hypothetical protein
MASADVMQEFLIALGFKIDLGSAQQFKKTTEESTRGTEQLKKSVESLNKALSDFSKNLAGSEQESNRRKVEENNRKLGLSFDGLRKGLVTVGTVAVTAGTAWVGALSKVAAQYDALFLTARRMGGSVADLKDAASAAQIAGVGLDTVQGAIEGVVSATRANPQMTLQISKWIGKDWNDVVKRGQQFKEGILPLIKTFKDMAESSPANRSFMYQYAEQLGMSHKMVDELIASYDDLIKREKEVATINKDAGLTPERVKAIADASREFWADIGKIGIQMNAIWTQALEPALPVMRSVLHIVESVLSVILKFNDAVPGAAMIETFGLIAGSARLLLGVVRSVIRGFGGMGPAAAKGAAQATAALEGAGAAAATAGASAGSKFGKAFKAAAVGYMAWEGLQHVLKPPEQRKEEREKALGPAPWWAKVIPDPADLVWGAARGVGSLFGSDKKPAAEAPIPPPNKKYAQGGIVPIDAHAGEIVLPADLSRGLLGMISAVKGSNQGFAEDVHGGDSRISAGKLLDWLGGMLVPKVKIDNVEDFEELAHSGAGGDGTEGGGGGGGAAGVNVPGYGQVTSDSGQHPKGGFSQQYGGTPAGAPSAVEGPPTGEVGKGASPYRAKQREQLFAEYDKWTDEQKRTMSIMMNKESKDALESLANRVPGETGTRLNRTGTLWEGLSGHGAYSTYQAAAAAAARGEGSVKEADRLAASVRAGSDVLGGRSDQGMWTDPGHRMMHAPGAAPGTQINEYGQAHRIARINNEWYSDKGTIPLAKRDADLAAQKEYDAKYAPGGGGTAPVAPGVPSDGSVLVPGAAGRPHGGGMNAPGGAYGVPGAVMNYADTSKAIGAPGQNQTQIKTPSGKSVTVNKAAAEAFQGFLGELEGTGYKINSIGGFAGADRKKRGQSSLSEHAYGNAIDINPGKNAMGGKGTDMPANVKEIAAKYGLVWGGDWSGGSYDPMHFQWGGSKPWQNRAMASRGAGAGADTEKKELVAAPTKTQQQQNEERLAQTGRPMFPPGTKFNARGEAVSADLFKDLPGQQSGANVPKAVIEGFVKANAVLHTTTEKLDEVKSKLKSVNDTAKEPTNDAGRHLSDRFKKHQEEIDAAKKQMEEPPTNDAGRHLSERFKQHAEAPKLKVGGALDKTFDRALAPIETSGKIPGGDGDTINNGNNRNMNMNATNNITINGNTGESPGRTAGRYSDAHRRIYGDMHRDLRANMA